MTQEERWILMEKYGGQKCEAFLADCNRLHSGEPLAYIIGVLPFHQATIYLDSHPLIPRTETEYWLGEIIPHIHKYAEKHTRVRILDLCAGSGCIGISVLKEIPTICVDFAEIDASHHPTIQKNIMANNIETSRTHIYGGDLFHECPHTYDFILTNPPYIDKTLSRVEKSVTMYEPERALYGGKNGLEIIERILNDALHYLVKHGTLVIEHEPEQAKRILEIGLENSLTCTHLADQYGVLRASILVVK